MIYLLWYRSYIDKNFGDENRWWINGVSYIFGVRVLLYVYWLDLFVEFICLLLKIRLEVIFMLVWNGNLVDIYMCLWNMNFGYIL